jgi:alpha-beta hydrolase superfamily lysophospholipase
MSAVAGHKGSVEYRVWKNPDARHLIVLAHGYGEHIGRYEHVAELLVARGAVVAGPDHAGHGRSEGERVLIEDYDAVVDDLQLVVEALRAQHPDLPFVLVGHSMGGLIAARYAQRHREGLAGLVLSGPVLGSWTAATQLLALEEIPDDPLPPETLSRDDSVGAAYGADELVWHGPFKRETLLALDRGLKAVNDGPELGDLPTLWVHGAEDQLVPIGETRTGIETLGFTDLEEHVYGGARHEVFNETNKDEVLGTVADFVDRVTAT